jgi:excinuclease UvrABC ATPase subunit
LHQLFFTLRDQFGQTLVIVNHDESFASQSDRIIGCATALSNPPMNDCTPFSKRNTNNTTSLFLSKPTRFRFRHFLPEKKIRKLQVF